jgi:hypothetical protein
MPGINRLKYISYLLAFLVLSAPLIDAQPAKAAAVVGIVLDGQFNDWVGKMHMTDPANDAAAGGDIVDFYWANNPGVATDYWMIQRQPSDNWVCYILYLDTNNNGQFRDRVDRVLVVQYYPQKKDSRVKLTVRYGDTGQVIRTTNNMDWGESTQEGGGKVEFSASFADLGIGIGQTTRMYVTSYTMLHMQKQSIQDIDKIFDDSDKDEEHDTQPPAPVDRAPDRGDIQWSPVPILGYWGLGIAVAGVGALWYIRDRRRRASVTRENTSTEKKTR